MRVYPWRRKTSTRSWEMRMTWLEDGELKWAYAHATDLEIAQWDEGLLNRRRSALIVDVLNLFKIVPVVVRRGH